MNPWEDLAAHWRNLAPDLQVYDTLTDKLDVPCLVLRPGSPWVENGADGASWGTDQERYEAFAVVGATDPAAGQRAMHRLVHFIIANLPDGWDWESVGAPGATDPKATQGVTYLAVGCLLTYRECTGGNPYDIGASSP